MARRLGLTLSLALALSLVFGMAAEAGTTYSRSTVFGIWEVRADQLGEVAGHKVNLIVKAFSPTMDIRGYLDEAYAQGKKVVVYFVNTVDYPSGRVFPGRVAYQVAKVRNHPGLYGYLSVKEPSWWGISLAEMRSLYRAYRDADPNHRVIALLGDTPHFGTSANPWSTGVANTLWVNWYPVLCSRGFLTTASTHFPKVRAHVDRVTPGMPIWLMVQGHTNYAGDKCTPTTSQLSRQVRDGFSYLKAKGILFYTWNNARYDKDLRRTPSLRDHIKTIVSQVRKGTF